MSQEKEIQIKDDRFAGGAISIEGLKRYGKTWSSSYHSNSEYLIVDPANSYQNRSFAEIAPAIVFKGDTPRLIDEWHEAPLIWGAVRYAVDQRAKKAQLILNESYSRLLSGIQQT